MLVFNRRKTTQRRRGMTVVESALVLSVFCLLMFGAFEYSRFLYVLHITNNAARDAARYAVVNMDKPSTFDYADYTYNDGTKNVTVPCVKRYTDERMGVTQKQLEGYKVAVFAVDGSGITETPLVIRPKSKNPPAYPDPFNRTDQNRVPWNQATFTEGIAVRIDGTYRPILPAFLFMPSTLKVSVTAVSNSEG